MIQNIETHLPENLVFFSYVFLVLIIVANEQCIFIFLA